MDKKAAAAHAGKAWLSVVMKKGAKAQGSWWRGTQWKKGKDLAQCTGEERNQSPIAAGFSRRYGTQLMNREVMNSVMF